MFQIQICLKNALYVRPQDLSLDYRQIKTAQYCATCKKDGMIDLKNPKCKSEWCDTRYSNKNYEGYYAFCFMHIYPDKPIARNYKRTIS